MCFPSRGRAYTNHFLTAQQYWEPAKFAAKLRSLYASQNETSRLVLLDTNMGAGHFGASGRYDNLDFVAFEYAFLIGMLARQRNQLAV